MKKTNALISCLTIMMLLIVGCSDDDSNCIPDITGELKTNETVLTHEWVLAEIVSEKEVDLTDDEEDNPSKDIFAQYSECERDAIYEFKDDRSFTYKQGEAATDCDVKLTSTGTWKLTEDVLTLVSSCSMRNIEVKINTEKTSFSIEDDYNLTGVDGKVIRSKVKFTYNKVVPAD